MVSHNSYRWTGSNPQLYRRRYGGTRFCHSSLQTPSVLYHTGRVNIL